MSLRITHLYVTFLNGWSFIVSVAGTLAFIGSRFTLVWREMRKQTRHPKWLLLWITFHVVPCYRGITCWSLVVRFSQWSRPIGGFAFRDKNEGCVGRANTTLALLPGTLLVADSFGQCRLTHRYLFAGESQRHCEDNLVPLNVMLFLVECPSLVDSHRRFLAAHHSADWSYLLASMLGTELSHGDGGLTLFLRAVGLLPLP